MENFQNVRTTGQWWEENWVSKISRFLILFRYGVGSVWLNRVSEAFKFIKCLKQRASRLHKHEWRSCGERGKYCVSSCFTLYELGPEAWIIKKYHVYIYLGSGFYPSRGIRIASLLTLFYAFITFTSLFCQEKQMERWVLRVNSSHTLMPILIQLRLVDVMEDVHFQPRQKKEENMDWRRKHGEDENCEAYRLPRIVPIQNGIDNIVVVDSPIQQGKQDVDYSIN